MNTPPMIRLLVMLWTAASLFSPRVLAQTAQVLPTQNVSLVLRKQEDRKISFAYRASQFYLLGATVLDGTTTAHLMSHPTTALRADGSLLAHYYPQEVGWAAFLGNRNKFVAVGANVGANALETWVANRLYRRGKWGKVFATGLNVTQGTFSLLGGIHNIKFGSNIDGRIHTATDYAGHIKWQ